MNFLRNIFSSSITFFLVPLLLIYLIVTGIFGVLLNQSTFQKTIEQNDTYQRIATKIIPSVIINIAAKNEDGAFLPPKAIENLVAKVDKNVLANDLERVVNDTYNFVTSEQQNFETKIDLVTYTTVIKNNLKPTLIEYYDSLPACSSEEEKLFTDNFSAEVKCKSSQVSSAKFVQSLEVDNIINELNSNFPTTLIVTEKEISTVPETSLFKKTSVNSNSQTNDTPLVSIQKSIKLYKSSENLLLATIIFLVLLLAVSRLKNIASMSKWVSSAFFSASFLPLVSTTLTLYFIKPEFFQKVLLDAFGVKELSLAISDILFSFSQKILQSIQFKSLLVIVISIALYGFYLYLEYSRKHKANKPLDDISKSTHNIN